MGRQGKLLVFLVALLVSTNLFAATSYDSVFNPTSGRLDYVRSSNGVLAVVNSTPKTRCFVIEELSASDDNYCFGSWESAVTITSAWCNYSGSATTAAQMSLEDSDGNAMTHTTPTCTAQGTEATAQSVTAANTLSAREELCFDVDNSPSPETLKYTLCVTYTS